VKLRHDYRGGNFSIAVYKALNEIRFQKAQLTQIVRAKIVWALQLSVHVVK